MVAIDLHRFEMVKYLLEEVDQTSLDATCDEMGSLPLHFALEHLPLLKYLVEVHSVDTTLTDNSGETALVRCQEEGWSPARLYLIDVEKNTKMDTS